VFTEVCLLLAQQANSYSDQQMYHLIPKTVNWTARQW